MNKKTLILYEFDEFRLDADQKCLWHSDEMVPLTPKALETLLVLIKHRGEIVGKDVLLDEVWADTFVEESTLSQNILTLRKTLGTFEKGKQFIVTVPRRGYRFVGEVKEIVGDEKFSIVERRTRMHIVAEQIHDSLESAKDKAAAVVVEPFPQKIFRPRRTVLGAILLGAIVLAGGFFALRYLLQTPKLVEIKFQKFSSTSIFSSSTIQQAVISPNGKYLALLERKGDVESLIVRQIAEANSLEIVPKLRGQLIGAVFSPDSDYLYYSVYTKTETNLRQGELYKIPVLGGTPRQIVKDIDSPAAVSADGRKIAFIRRRPPEKETALIIADSDGQNEHKLAARQFGEGFQNAAFSPDGKFISGAAVSRADPAKPMEIVVVNTENGEQRSFTSANLTWIGQTAWLSDASGIAFVAYSANSPNLTDEVWFISFPEGRSRLLEKSISGIFGLSLTADSNSIVTVKSNKITSFAISSLDDPAKQTTLLTKMGDESLLPLGADWTADGQIIYSTTNNGNADLWTIKADGTGQKQMTSDASADFSPKSSVDGTSVYFLSNRTSLTNIWRMNADGTNPQVLREKQDVFAITLSPDGKEIFYTARAENIFMQRLWKMSADGKNVQQLTDKTTLFPKLAPDGRSVACFFPDATGAMLKLTLLSAETGAVLRQFETPPSEGLPLFEWKSDGHSLILAGQQNGAGALWLQPLDGRAAVKLKEWPGETIFRLAISKDGTKIFYEKGVTANNVLLLSNTK